MVADEGPRQDFVDKSRFRDLAQRLELHHVCVDEQPAVAAECTERKLRADSRGYGYSSALELTDAREALELGCDLAERLELTGVAKLDFKYDDDSCRAALREAGLWSEGLHLPPSPAAGARRLLRRARLRH